MRRAILIILALVFLALYYVGKQSLVDPTAPSASQEDVTSRQFSRIVSTAPSITEVLFELDASDRVAAVTEFCKYPPEAQEKQILSGSLYLNLESLSAARPDLVVLTASREHEQLVDAFRRIALPSVSVDHNSIDGILESIRTLGKLTGTSDNADRLVAARHARMDAIRQAIGSVVRPSVLLSVGRTLGSSGGFREVYAAGVKTVYNDVLELAGGINACPVTAARYPLLSADDIYSLDPDLIVDMLPAPESGVTEAQSRSEWQSLKELRAIRKGRLLIVKSDYATIPGPRIVQLVEELARAMHPGISLDGQ